MSELIPIEVIENRILIIRGQKVMIDRDLAELYQVETRVLNQAVKGILKGFLLNSCSNSMIMRKKNWSQIVIGLKHLSTLHLIPILLQSMVWLC